MSLLSVLMVVWGVLTAILVILMIYKSTLTIHEEEQLYLDDSESHMQAEQLEIQAKVGKVTPLLRLFGAASGMLILVIAGIWIWQGLNQVQ